MDTSELKNSLHKFIVETNDAQILIKLKQYAKSLRSNNSLDWWDELTDAEKTSVQKGLDDLEAGRVHTDKYVRKNVRQKIEAAKQK